MFCHVRFTRPMLEGDSLEIKVQFHESPICDGQCLLSITPPEFLHKKAKSIVQKNPFVIDPTRAWVSNLKDDDTKRFLQFGIKYIDGNTITYEEIQIDFIGAIQIRLPGDVHFFNFYHVPADSDPICIDVFFCEYVKSISLCDPIESQNSDDIPLIYQKRSAVMIV
uniref:Galectin n=1 Tax=Caenorhabditis tropicalis TaxID=1561998 RepID=A0A1I7U090_9PELO